MFLLQSTTSDSVKAGKETNAIDWYCERTKCTCEKEWRGLGDGSDGTVPTLQAEGPEFEPQNPYTKPGHWRHSSALKSTFCSCRGLGFGSQHSSLSVTQVLGNLSPSSGLFGQLTCAMHRYKGKQNTHTRKKKKSWVPLPVLERWRQLDTESQPSLLGKLTGSTRA